MMTKNWFGTTGTPTSTFSSCSPSTPSPSSCWWWSTSRGKGRATAMRTTMPNLWRESGKNRLLEDDLGRERTWYQKNRTKEVLVVHLMREAYLPSINHCYTIPHWQQFIQLFYFIKLEQSFWMFFPPCHHQSSISDLFRYTDKSLYDSTGRKIEPRQANEKVQYLKIPTIHRDA